jgi:DNA-binding transcriptional ArsR family regulator
MFVSDPLRQFKAQVFQALAHPTRIAVLDELRDGERSAGQIAERLRLEQANLSQHLAVLRAKGVVTTRKAGNQVFYAIRDAGLLVRILDLLRDYFHTHLHDTLAILGEMDESNTPPA